MKDQKIVFITGGDKGIGKAIVEIMAQNYVSVIFTYNVNVQGANAITKNYNNVFSYQCDLKNRENTKDLADNILNKFGHIDILINNAGYENDAIFDKMNATQWDDVIDINLRSVFNFTHSFIKGMKEKKWGRVINLTSIAGLTGAFGKSNYAAAKAGIIGFNKTLALEYAKHGITINAVAPGAINTDMLNRIPSKYLEKILENIPMGRFGETEEVAKLVYFLCSNDASYITGQTIHINGGSYL
jgi:NAD(P)-dependent dehydrogenase (short-subunit alcohol dehydrogenase family)